MRTSSLILFLGLIAPYLCIDTTACQPGWEWASNSFRQTPCEIAGLLEAECGSLPTTSFLRGATRWASGHCDCNTVMFSLQMACAACQNFTTQSWSCWKRNCTQPNIAQYPGVIPQDTAIPNWAYIDYTIGGRFDVAAAKLAGDQPERFATVPANCSIGSGSTPLTSISTCPSGVPAGNDEQSNSQSMTSGPLTGLLQSSSASSTTGGPTSTTTAFDQQKNNQTRKSSRKTASIIGGVVGPVLAVLGVAAWYFYRVRKRSGGETNRGQQDYPEPSGSVLTSEHGLVTPRVRSRYLSGQSTIPDQIDYATIERYASLTSYLGYHAGAAELLNADDVKGTRK